MQYAVCQCSILVNCRIGSLENSEMEREKPQGVNCRIGSLESEGPGHLELTVVNCRIGSLEKNINN